MNLIFWIMTTMNGMVKMISLEKPEIQYFSKSKDEWIPIHEMESHHLVNVVKLVVLSQRNENTVMFRTKYPTIDGYTVTAFGDGKQFTMEH